MKDIPSISVLGIPLFDGSISDFYQIMIRVIESERKMNRQISFCDANVLVSTKRNEHLRDILERETYINMPDGMPGVWIGKLKGAKNIKRCYGPDTFEFIVKQTALNEHVKHYFTGGRNGVADQLKVYCQNTFGNSNIAGVHCPPFREMDESEIKEIADEINSTGANVVWVGISSPKQDIYAQRLSKYLKVHFIFTVGAAFDFFTGNVKQAPRFIQRSGFEWLFRLLMEPKRLWKRYFMVIPLFIYYNLSFTFKGKRI